ncbi:MAG: hypothetical protein LBQ57_11215 [Spirochaetales bacterium]|jgi:hypothetical protein|nr:hypothetical protein [Spirochaetales bacterium]
MGKSIQIADNLNAFGDCRTNFFKFGITESIARQSRLLFSVIYGAFFASRLGARTAAVHDSAAQFCAAVFGPHS